MVCRDANTHRAKAVNPLIISTPEERALYSLGEGTPSPPLPSKLFPTGKTEMKTRRQALALRSLSRVPPSSTEAEELHSFFLKYGQEQPDNGAERVWMGDTIAKKTMLMFPQERKYVCLFYATA